MSKSIKTLATGAEWVLIGMIVARFLGYFYKLIVARIGASEYGVLSLGIALVSILVSLAIVGLDRGILRYVAFYKTKQNYEKVRGGIIGSFWISGIISLIAMVFVLIYSKNISLLFFGDEALYYIIQILSVTLPFYVFAKIFLSSIRAFEKIRYTVYSEYFIQNILKILVALILIYGFSLGIFGAAIAHVISIISVAFFSFYFLNKYVFKIFGEKDLSVSKEILSYSWPLMIGALCGVLIARIDSLMIGYLMKDASQIGIYNAALPTAMLMLMSVYIMLSLFTPVMSDLLAKGDGKGMNKAYKSVVKWSFLMNFPLLLVMFFLSKDILSVLFGSVYAAGWKSLSILAVGYFNYSTLFASRNVLEVFKKTKLVMINIVITLAIGIILNYFLILRYGIVGAAIATTISLSFLGVLYLIEIIVLKKLIPFDKHYIKLILINVGCFYFVYKILNLFLKASFLYFILFGVMFGILYVILLIKLKCLDEEELSFVREKLRF